MGNPENKPELSETMLEIGAKLFPRRYRRFKDLRSAEEARKWAQTLDWKNNPYDRFLLRREILHQLESNAFYRGRWNVYTFASRAEIAEEVERLIDKFSNRFAGIGIINYVLVSVPWHLAFKHGRIRRSRLAAALGKLGQKA